MKVALTSDITLPASLQAFFWDCDFAALSWNAHRDFIIRRLLQRGAWDSIQWLRRKIGDPVLRAWIIAHAGGGLAPRQSRFWELILDLPPEQVDWWFEISKNSVWGKRVDE